MSYTEDYVRVFSTINDPRISITVDTGHFTGSQVDVIDFIEKLAPHINYVHLKDHINTQSVAFACGNTDNLAIMNHLASKGFSGYATVELELEDTENIQQYLREAREYCLNYLGLVE